MRANRQQKKAAQENRFEAKVQRRNCEQAREGEKGAHKKLNGKKFLYELRIVR